jgi:hypothetical protein
MRIRLVFFGIAFIGFFVHCETRKAANEKETSIKIERDYVNRISRIFLESNNGKKIDSLILHDQYFSIDSLIRMDNSTWHYMYSPRCGSNCYSSYQILIGEKNKKINLKYVSPYESGFDFDDTYIEGVKPEQLMEVTHASYIFKFDSMFNEGLTINEYIFNGQRADDGSGKSTKFKLNFDQREGVYFNRKVILKGQYVIFENQNMLMKEINKEVLSIKFTENEYLYIEGKWYEVDFLKKKLWLFVR